MRFTEGLLYRVRIVAFSEKMCFFICLVPGDREKMGCRGTN